MKGGKRIYELTPAGRQLWQMLLEAGSRHAGRDIDGDDISAAMQLIRLELGQSELDLPDPKVREALMRYLAGSQN